MSDAAPPDNAPEPPDAAAASNPPADSIGEEAAKRRKVRQLVLVGLLGLMLVALAYDYGVARPSVDEAFEQIVQLNDRMNSQAKMTPTLNADVHTEIGRDPSRAYTDGAYRVEVFSWTSGLPFRTHDLFAVYMPNGNDLVFMRHYKYEIPPGELTPPNRVPDDDQDSTDLPPSPSGIGVDRGGPGRGGPGGGGPGGGGGGPGRPPGGGGGEGRPQRPSGEESDADPGSDEGAPSGDAPSAAPLLGKPAAEKPAAEKPAAEKPAAEKPAAEKPAAEKPAAEKPATEAAPAAASKAPAATEGDTKKDS